MPRGTFGNWERHADGGPPGWDAAFGQVEEPLTDQWPHQAVSAIVLAHSLLRTFPEVDAGRIGLTGISWGGYLTCLTAGVDPRFRLAVPVYGCGNLADDSAYFRAFADAILGDQPAAAAPGLPTITGQGTGENQTWVTWRGGRPIRAAEVCFTTAAGRWQDRPWETQPATIHPAADGTEGRASAVVPAGATAWYLNLVDEAGLVVSGEHAVR